MKQDMREYECHSIKILSFDLELIDEVDLYTSLDFYRSLQGTGDFMISLPEIRNSIAPGNIIVIGSDPHKSGIIRAISKVSDSKGTVITAVGQTLDGFTSQRCILPLEDNAGYFSVPPQSEHRSVSAEEIIKKYISYHLGDDVSDGKRRLQTSYAKPMLKIGELLHRGYPTEWGCRYTQLDEELQSICEYCDCGYEIYADIENGFYVAEYINGVDRSTSNTQGNSPVVFSINYENIESITYEKDMNSYKNVGYAGGKGEGENRTVIAVTNDSELARGIDRFEVFIDCGELESVETETAMSLTETGRHKLEEHNCVETLTAQISASCTFVYGKDYDIGDIVTVMDTDLGIAQDMRISGVRETYETNGYRLTIEFGKTPKRIKRAIRNIKTTVK